MSVEIYRPKVTELISKADITTVSARNIRKQIEALTNSSLDHVKRDFDEMVMEIYEKITDDIERAVLNGSQAPGAQTHQQQQPQTGFATGFALPPTSYVPPPPPPAPAPAPSPSEESESEGSDSDASDASYSSLDEETGRRRRKKPKVVKKESKAAKKEKQEKQEKNEAQAKARKKKLKAKEKKLKNKDKEPKPRKKREPAMNEDGTVKVNPFNQPMVISDKLAEVIGQAGSIGPSGRIEMSRPQCVKQLWVYIKANNLQLENDKRVIACDEKLKSVFGVDQVSIFSMNKYLSSHLSKVEELV
ncbi:hypothetical protein EC968_000309 [Mortierella alpina]|nr:hypothetical protein EC968_000309 [Mortierella alpina]